MGAKSKQDYPALIAEHDQLEAAGKTLQEIRAMFEARGVNWGTYGNQRRAAKKSQPTPEPKAKKLRRTAAPDTAPTERHSPMTRLTMEDIMVKPDIQQRVKLSQDLIDEYVELMREGETLPPVVVFGPVSDAWTVDREGASHDGYFLSEGFHRYYASERLGFLEIDAEIHQGGYDEAVDYACEANLKHGLRPLKADRLKAMITQLQFHRHDRSDREIARRCGVSPTTVGEYRKKPHSIGLSGDAPILSPYA